MGILTVKLQNVILQLETIHEDVLRCARGHFSGQVISDQQYVDVHVLLDYRTGVSLDHESFRFDGSQDCKLLGYHTYVSADRIDWYNIWDCPGLKLSHWRNGGRHFYHAVYHEIQDGRFIVRLLKRMLQRRTIRAMREDIANQLIEYLIYYPIFWFLEHERGLRLCHASGVELEQGGVIFPGLAGVGKSTVSMYLFSRWGGRILSDNLLFYDEKKVYACLEPILLASYGQGLLENGDPRVIATGGVSVYNRRAFSISDQYRSEEVTPSAVILLARSVDGYVRRLSLDETIARTLDSNAIAGETKRYHTFSAMMNLMSSRHVLSLERAKLLKSLLADVACFEVGVQSGVALEEVIDGMLRKELEKLSTP